MNCPTKHGAVPPHFDPFVLPSPLVIELLAMSSNGLLASSFKRADCALTCDGAGCLAVASCGVPIHERKASTLSEVCNGMAVLGRRFRELGRMCVWVIGNWRGTI